MLLLIIFGTMLIGGVIWYKLDDWTIIGMILGIVGGVGLFICIIIALTAPIEYKTTVIKYNQYMEYKEKINTNGLTEIYNTKILYHRTYCENPWVGIYFSKEIASLELIPFIDGQSIDNPTQVYLKD